MKTVSSPALTVGADPGSHVGDYESAFPWHGLLEDVRLYWGELDQDELRKWSEQP